MFFKKFIKKTEKTSCRRNQNNFQKAENLKKKIRFCRKFLYAYEN